MSSTSTCRPLYYHDPIIDANGQYLGGPVYTPYPAQPDYTYRFNNLPISDHPIDVNGHTQHYYY